ncbi:alcohol dehydrogenase [Teratosphaeria nubilosa]|uniref:Alcohol dehydrogenase n=1 Tax=Teratosphaeria nubilosa TaxID=161662 RepID=A0A6G1LG35_9PEZI|nr:alcohol dehydrogenase [Teratosphaeria nubilosa]
MPKAVSIRQIEGKPGKVYYPLEIVKLSEPKPKDNEVVVKITAAALNHRDLFIRQHLYPGIKFGVPMLADGSGVVVATGSSPQAKKWQGKKVIINPGSGWKDDPEGPESPAGYAMLGGTRVNPLGTLSETVTIDAGELEEQPRGLTAIEGAALPLTGLTAWRAVMTKSQNAKPGHNILVTGIGGGVALMALLIAAAAGANVYVTSGSEEKINKAKALGAKWGVNYKEKDWAKKLVAQLPSERKTLDAIIDGAGGDVVDQGIRIMKPGGVIVSYGMTLGPKINYSMAAVMRNIDVRGSTMGSRKEFADMVKFVESKNLKPVVSRVVSGIENFDGINGLFEDMKQGAQFGKLVIEISKEGEASKL